MFETLKTGHEDDKQAFNNITLMNQKTIKQTQATQEHEYKQE